MKHYKSLLFWLLSYPLGIFLWLFLSLLDLFNKIEVIGLDNLKSHKGLIIASNHPSLWEPIILYYLFMPELFYRPSITPLSLVYQCNYAKNKKWFPFWPLFISIDRDSGQLFGSYEKARKHLLNKGNLIIFPEGGRTSSGNQLDLIRYYNGACLKPLQSGVCSLAKKTKSFVVPVWVNGTDHVLPRGTKFPRFWRKTTIVVGEPYKVLNSDVKKASKRLSRRILDLYNKIKVE